MDHLCGFRATRVPKSISLWRFWSCMVFDDDSTVDVDSRTFFFHPLIYDRHLRFQDVYLATSVGSSATKSSFLDFRFISRISESPLTRSSPLGPLLVFLALAIPAFESTAFLLLSVAIRAQLGGGSMTLPFSCRLRTRRYGSKIPIVVCTRHSFPLPSP
eukprot:scaffold3337_cov169-Amphora_coffeaeformis.AAC.7